jgi:glycosyltransferase involved in cell wall biosynthesis
MNNSVNQESVLLSIVIPSKNRQNTCLHAIESALAIDNNDFEIIVQDCSDTDILKSQILEKFGDDSRIKYSFSIDKPDMTTNWNRAYDMATGEYQCGIGDDDSILKEIYDLALWAKKNNLPAIVNASQIIYIWPDFDSHFFSGTFMVSGKSSSILKKLKDQKTILDLICQEPSSLYTRLPMGYHCLISRDQIIKPSRNKNQGLFHGTSLDVYSSVVFTEYYDSYVSIDFPFTIRGASGKSNSSRFHNKKIQEHFNEFKNHNFGKICPQTPTLDTTLLESIEKGLTHLGQLEKLDKLNIPMFYAKIVAQETNLLKLILQYGKQNFVSNKDWINFIGHLIKYKLQYTYRDIGRLGIVAITKIFGKTKVRNIRHKMGLSCDYVEANTINSNLNQLRKYISPIRFNDDLG